MNINDQIKEESGILFLKKNKIDKFLEKINDIKDVKQYIFWSPGHEIIEIEYKKEFNKKNYNIVSIDFNKEIITINFYKIKNDEHIEEEDWEFGYNDEAIKFINEDMIKILMKK